MIRIHVLLLASLLSIWGLTSCENSDTDKVNSYNPKIRKQSQWQSQLQ